MIKFMEKENLNGAIQIIMKVSGKIIKNMDLA